MKQTSDAGLASSEPHPVRASSGSSNTSATLSPKVPKGSSRTSDPLTQDGVTRKYSTTSSTYSSEEHTGSGWQQVTAKKRTKANKVARGRNRAQGPRQGGSDKKPSAAGPRSFAAAAHTAVNEDMVSAYIPDLVGEKVSLQELAAQKDGNTIEQKNLATLVNGVKKLRTYRRIAGERMSSWFCFECCIQPFSSA